MINTEQTFEPIDDLILIEDDRVVFTAESLADEISRVEDNNDTLEGLRI